MKRAGMAGVILALLSTTAHAQMAVLDGANLVNTTKSVAAEAVAAGKRLEMINNQILQLVRLKQTFEAVSHGDLAALANLAPELGSVGLTSPLGEDMPALASSIAGLGGDLSQTASLAESLRSTDQLYAPSGADFRAVAINQAAAALSSQKALAEMSLQSSGARLANLTALRKGLGDSPDVKAAADATARLTGEQATATAQGNQLLAAMMLQNVQTATDAAREQQLARCSAERLTDEAKRAKVAADSGTIQLETPSDGAIKCAVPTNAGQQQAAALMNASYTTGGTSFQDCNPSSSLDTMAAQPWGQQAANNAAALGVNPDALAATCVLESNCTANPGGTGTISGAFQMSDGTYAQTVGEVQASNPNLASQITSKNDPASQSIAAAQYLKDGALSLQGSGIANPTVLDVRGYYNFGPANGAALAAASGNQLMSDAMPGLSAATLRANGISDTTTVGAWRAGVTSKIGAGTASQSVLTGLRST